MQTGNHSANREQQMYEELVRGIVEVLGEKIVCIVLYGSVARGRDTPDSDVDIALLMHGRLDAELLDKVLDVNVQMNLKYDKLFSLVDIDIAHWLNWKADIPYYRNIEEEGIILWKRNDV